MYQAQQCPVHQTHQSISAPLRRVTSVFIFLICKSALTFHLHILVRTFGKPGQNPDLGFCPNPLIIHPNLWFHYAAELLFRVRFCILVCVVFTLCDYLIIKFSFPFSNHVGNLHVLIQCCQPFGFWRWMEPMRGIQFCVVITFY